MQAATLSVIAEVARVEPVSDGAEPVFALDLRPLQVAGGELARGAGGSLLGQHWYIGLESAPHATGKPYTSVGALLARRRSGAAATASDAGAAAELLPFLVKRYKGGRVSNSLCGARVGQLVRMAGPVQPSVSAEQLAPVTILCAQVRPPPPPRRRRP